MFSSGGSTFMILKNSNNSNKFFSNLLIYITIQTVIVIGIVSAALYYSFRSTQLSNIYDNSKDNLSQVSYSTNFMVDSAKALLVQMFYDDNVSMLRYVDNLEPQQIYTACRLIKNYGYTMPFVDSIYIYNGNTDTYYTNVSNMSSVKGSEFVDKEITEILKHPKDINITKPIARKISSSNLSYLNRQTTNVFTFIYMDPSSSGDGVDSAIIINVSEQWVRKVINALNLDNTNKILIIDGKGQIISSIFGNEILSNISNDSYYNNFIHNLNNPSGNFINNYKNNKSLITYVSADGPDWKFIRIVPYSKITEMLIPVRNITLLICSIILCLGLIISIVVSRRVYKPIKDVITNLKALAEGKNNSQEPIKEDYLKKLTLNEISFDLSEFIKNTSDYNILINHKSNLSMILLSIDHYSDFCNKYNSTDKSILKYGVINIAREILKPTFNCEGIDISNNHIIIIFNQPTPLNDDTIFIVDNFLKEIQTTVLKCLNISLSCTLGPQGYDVKEIAKLYSETSTLSNNRTFYGHSSIIYYSDLRNTEEYIYPIEAEKSLIDALLLEKPEEVKKQFEIIINKDFSHCQYSQFDSTLLRLAFSISTAIETIERAQHLKVDYSFSTFIGKFSNLETLDEIKAHFYSMFDIISLKLEKKKIFKYDDLINKIIDIIKLEYMDTNLCLDSIADSVNMSSVYLGRLFKKNTLKSVSDYINDIRMDHAVNYLSTTNMSINDIVEKVGFSNRSYFHTIFKKVYATTPNDYRKNLQNKTLSQ